MAEHRLKCWPDYYAAIERGDKNFEVRRDDRGFQRGDTLILCRFNPEYGGRYTGQQTERTITYILTGGQWGIEPGYVVMALAAADREPQR